MHVLLQAERFQYLSPQDKAFILDFNAEMARLGYDFGGQIGSGYCWGNHMVIYTRTGVKSKNVYARIYMRNTGVILRLYLNRIEDHRAYLEKAPSHIKEPFTGAYGNCQHCKNQKDGVCQFRKTYTLDGRFIEKCNGFTFEFSNPASHALSDYIALFTEFFPRKKAGKAQAASH
jgi:hypothetical protein